MVDSKGQTRQGREKWIRGAKKKKRTVISWKLLPFTCYLGREKEGRMLIAGVGKGIEEVGGGARAFGQSQESRTMRLSTLSGADRIQECPES